MDVDVARGRRKIAPAIDTPAGREVLGRQVKPQVEAKECDARGKRHDQPTYLERPTWKIDMDSQPAGSLVKNMASEGRT